MQRIVRPATTLDCEPILDVAEAAFVTEPAFAHFFGDHYADHARVLLGYLLEVRLAGGLVWVEVADGQVVAASMWDPPGGLQLAPAVNAERWTSAEATFTPDAVRRLEAYEAKVHDLGPRGITST